MTKRRELIESNFFKIMAIVLLVALVSFLSMWTLGQEKVPELEKPTLKELGQSKGIDVGNFAIRSYLDDPAYSKILTENFNLALADNTPNWYFTDGGLRPSRDEFFFDHMNEVVEFAEKNEMKIQSHHYLWGEEKWLPDWLKNGNYSKEELEVIFEEHIQVVGQKYAGRVDEWTVVNEAFTRGQGLYGLRDWWGDNTGGKEYIDKAFLAARKADPNSVLILNDFGNESINEVSNEMFSYVESAKKRGVPIDGIGMQMHIDGTHPPMKDEVITNMKRFGEIGVDVYVTEFDVNMNDVKTSPEDKDKIQGDIYYEMARACIESTVCKSFAILGITDKETWYNYVGATDPRPLPFDKEYQPKPAYFELRRAFQEK